MDWVNFQSFVTLFSVMLFAHILAMMLVFSIS